MSKRTGAMVSLVVSTVLWIFVFVVPLLDADPQTKWFAAAGLYGSSYVFFFLAIGLVGRDGYQALKQSLLHRLRRGGAALDEAPGLAPQPPDAETSQNSPSPGGQSD